MNEINNFLNAFSKIIPAPLWRGIIHVWSVAAMLIFAYEFSNGNPRPEITVDLSIIYIIVLTVYVGTKEFRRWSNSRLTRRYGELYVLAWTVMMLIFMILTAINKNLHISPDLAATYIAVISLFAVARESKRIYRQQH